MTPWAVFIGYKNGVAFYRVIDPDQAPYEDGSPVNAARLESVGIRVPHTPTFKQWTEEQHKKALDNVSGGGYAN